MRLKNLSIALACLMLPEAAAWGRTFTANDLNFEVISDSEHTVRVLGHTTTSGTINHLVIPGTVQENSGSTSYTVTEVGPAAFKGRIIERMTIERGPGELFFAGDAMEEASVSSLSVSRNFDAPVNHRPFSHKDMLTSVTFGEGITFIPIFSFAKCPLSSTITIPSSVGTIGYGAFQKTDISGVKFASTKGLAHIGGEAFWACHNLTSIEIPEGVTWIGETCFGNTPLTSISLPSTLYQIDKRAFANCPYLKSVTLAPSNPYFNYKDGVLTQFDDTYVVSCFNVGNTITVHEGVTDIGWWSCIGLKIKELKLPSTLKRINEYGIYNCRDMVSINLPEGLDSIGEGGLAYSTGLKELKLPESLKKIGPYAFVALGTPSINIPAGLKEIPKMAFEISHLKSIDIPETVEKIDSSAFERCRLETVTFGVTPGTVTKLPHRVFYGCKQLKNITLPAYLDSIGSEVFLECEALESIQLPGELKEIGVRAFAGSYLKSIDIPESVAKIDTSAFESCRNLETVTFGVTPGTVTKLAPKTFFGCKQLKNITLPAYLNTISNEAFSGCKVLWSILLPGALKEIGEKAFAGATSLRNISTKACYPPTVPITAFDNDVYRYGTLTVPVGSAKLYAEAPVWELFGNIRESADLGSVDDITADIPDGPVVVYRLDGVKVYEGERAEMPALTPGVYLVNGRKVRL